MVRDEVEARNAAPAAAIESRPSAARRPFDPRDLDRLPKPTQQDPPHRDWWVIESGGTE